MPGVNTTYAFKDLVGALDNPLLDSPIQIAGGNIGVGKVLIRMLTERTELATAADGVVMPTYISGQSAEITMDMQQTSELHHAFLGLFNLLASAADGGDVSNWASTTLRLRTILDGSGHTCTGVGFKNIADKPYEAKGQNVTWMFLAASAVNQ